MKKKLLIVSHALVLGGAERALLGLLESLDPEIWDTDLFLMRHEGELMDMIPDHIRLLLAIPAYTVLARPMKDTLREGHLLLTAARLAGKLTAKAYARKHAYTESIVGLEYSHKFTCPLMPKIQPEQEYDLAISFLTPHYFVARKVRAKKKIAWIHTDYTQVQLNVESETSMWSAYDHIASISDAVTESFLKVFPSMEDRIVLIENILPEKLIRRQAEEFDAAGEMPPEGTRLLSIGRFCHQKNFDNVPDICARLLEQGLDVTWYLIGFGGDEALIRQMKEIYKLCGDRIKVKGSAVTGYGEELIRQKIREAGVENRVIVLGKRDNPYPYIKACDVYIQPSRYEGKAVTVREAQMLGKRVIITNYATAPSQLEDGVDGVTVPLDNAGCADAIAALLREQQTLNRVAEACRGRDYADSKQAEILVSLLEGDACQ